MLGNHTQLPVTTGAVQDMLQAGAGRLTFEQSSASAEPTPTVRIAPVTRPMVATRRRNMRFSLHAI